MKKLLIFLVLFVLNKIEVSGQFINLDSGLVGKYCLDGDAIDLSPNKNHGTLYSAQAVMDRFGSPSSAIELSGNNSYVQLDKKNLFNNTFTYAFWYYVQTNPASGSARIMFGAGGTDCDQTVTISNAYFGIYTGIGFGGYFNPTSTPYGLSTGTLPPIQQWNHIVTIKSSDSIKMFINGVLVDKKYAPQTPCYAGNDQGAKMGGRSGHNQFFAGRMDDLWIFNRALSDAEAIDLYKISNQFTFDIIPSAATLCVGDSVLLTPDAEGEKYIWSTGDTTKSIYIKEPGNYWLDIQRQCAAKRRQITINHKAYIKLGGLVMKCDDVKTPITIEVKDRIGTQVIWNTGDTGNTIGVLQPRFYSATAIFDGCSYTDSVELVEIITDQPKLGSDTFICANQSLILGSGNTSDTILWSTGATSPSITILDTGIYWVKFKNVVCEKYDSIHIGSAIAPLANLISDTFLCEGSSLQLSFQVNDAYNYRWDDGVTSDNRAFDKTGKYNMTYDYNGCSYNHEVIIQAVVPPINLLGYGDDTSTCFNQALTYDFGANPETYVWNNSLNSKTFSTTQPGMVYLQIIKQGCIFKDSILLNMTQPLENFPSLDTSICEGDSIFVNYSSADNLATYLWNDGISDAFRFLKSDGDWLLEIKSICETKTIKNKIKQTDCQGIYIPDAFSPNGDGMNDSFFVFINEPKTFNLLIYDRWGALIFSSSDYQVGWDGKYNGKLLPSGIYIYKFSALTFGNKKINRNGTISIIK